MGQDKTVHDAAEPRVIFMSYNLTAARQGCLILFPLPFLLEVEGAFTSAEKK